MKLIPPSLSKEELFVLLPDSHEIIHTGTTKKGDYIYNYDLGLLPLLSYIGTNVNTYYCIVRKKKNKVRIF